MSLDSTFVRCADGNWYREPVWHGVHEGKQWFIYFDEGHPQELVVAASNSVVKSVRKIMKGNGLLFTLAERILSDFRVPYTMAGDPQIFTGRFFPHDGWKIAREAVGFPFEFGAAPRRPDSPTRPTLAKNVRGTRWFPEDQVQVTP